MRSPIWSDPRARLAAPALLAAAAILATCGCGPARADGGPAETVVLVSIDGLRWDQPAAGAAPNLERMRAGGATADRLVPPFPPNTFPALATILTGAWPDRHGILNNRFLDRRRGPFEREGDAAWLLSEPLWAAAERQGIRTAVQHWVCSSTPWRGVSPAYTEPYTPGVRDAARVGRILEWLRMGSSKRPRLILSYLSGVDAAAHREGPSSPAVRRTIAAADRLVGRLMEGIGGLERPAALVVVSDHGMAPVSRVHRLDRLLTGEAKGVRSFVSGASANLYCRDAQECRAAERALRSVPGMEVYRREDLPASLRYDRADRTGDLVVVAPPGGYLAQGGGGRPAARGMHGFRPEVPEMHGVFHAWGAGVRPGARRARLRSVDVAAFVSRLLGIEPPAASEGEAPADLLLPVSPDRTTGDPAAGRRDPAAPALPL